MHGRKLSVLNSRTKNGRRPTITRPICSVTFLRISRHRRKKLYMSSSIATPYVHRSLLTKTYTGQRTAVSLSSYEHTYLLELLLTKLSEATRRRQTPSPYWPVRLFLLSLHAHYLQRDVHAPRIIHLTYNLPTWLSTKIFTLSSTTVAPRPAPRRKSGPYVRPYTDGGILQSS